MPQTWLSRTISSFGFLLTLKWSCLNRCFLIRKNSFDTMNLYIGLLYISETNTFHILIMISDTEKHSVSVSYFDDH
jgi:hypothetical protein